MPVQFKIEDGVTHFNLDHSKGKPLPEKLIREINAWRGLLRTLGWLGQDPKRYYGVGFGNVSQRLTSGRNPQFVISGTQTGHIETLTPRQYTTVVSSVPEMNAVTSKGPVKPSSESMTHAMIYRLIPNARVVFHVHAPKLWRAAAKHKLPSTGRHVPYGTPEMAQEVARLLRNSALERHNVFWMRGHKDGVVSFGQTADEAGLRLIELAKKAL